MSLALLVVAIAVLAASPALAAGRHRDSSRRNCSQLTAQDFDRVGVVPGARVRVTSGRGSVQLPLHPDRSLPEGVAFLSFNQRGEGAGDLIDIGAPVTDIRVETLRS